MTQIKTRRHHYAKAEELLDQFEDVNEKSEALYEQMRKDGAEPEEVVAMAKIMAMGAQLLLTAAQAHATLATASHNALADWSSS